MSFLVYFLCTFQNKLHSQCPHNVSDKYLFSSCFIHVVVFLKFRAQVGNTILSARKHLTISTMKPIPLIFFSLKFPLIVVIFMQYFQTL